MAGWGKKAFDRDGMRHALMTSAMADLTGNLGRVNEKTYLAALYAEQVRTNELLEALLTQMSGQPQSQPQVR